MRPYTTKTPIHKGWSCDKKYCVTDSEGTKYLLRITPFEKSAGRQDMFRMQKEVAALGIPMCRPVEIGECDEGVYILQTWIDGQDAEDVVPKLSDAEQYALGLEAGRILKKIHSIPAPEGQMDWEQRKRLISGCFLKLSGTQLPGFRYANILLHFIATFFLDALAPGSQFFQFIIWHILVGTMFQQVLQIFV